MTTPLIPGQVIEPRKTDIAALRLAEYSLSTIIRKEWVELPITYREATALCDELQYLRQLESILYPQWEKQNKEIMRLAKENEELRARVDSLLADLRYYQITFAFPPTGKRYAAYLGSPDGVPEINPESLQNILEERDELREKLATLSERVRNETRNRLYEAVNAECCCGGKGPDDPGVCMACVVWHRFNESLKSPGQTGGNHD